MNSIWSYVQSYPPFICRLLARTPGRAPRALTNGEIAQQSGLPEPIVATLSTQETWDDVSVGHMRAFVRGCDVDFGDTRRMKTVNFYFRARRKGKWKHLHKSPDWQTLFYPMLKQHIKGGKS
jgi:hypothetical protein